VTSTALLERPGSATENLDADTRALIAGLDEALDASGLTQSDFAAALGTSASRLSTYRHGKTAPAATFFLRARRIGHSLREAHNLGWMSSIRTADAIADALEEQDATWTLKMALQGRDHLRALLRERRDLAGAWEAAPPSSGSEQWDAFLAALTGHEFTSAGLPAPAWTQREPLTSPWVLGSTRLDAATVREQTPAWLSRSGIFIRERDLTTL
jgi:transcriptional regulator with XRE-family HTH domain